MITPIISLMEKYGWNGILYVFEFNPIGLLDPGLFKNKIWNIVTAITKNGNTNLKNQDKVVLSSIQYIPHPFRFWLKNL